MRWWRNRYSELVRIAEDLIGGAELDVKDLKLLRSLFLEWRDEVPPPAVELSVYACALQDARDLGHALGVVAVTLPLLRDRDDREHDRQVRRRNGATLLIPRHALDAEGFAATHTPHNCHTLCVAAPHHWDLCAEGAAVERLFHFFCEQLKEVSNLYKIDPDAKSSATEQPFKDQARLALGVCCSAPWSLRADGPCGDCWHQAGAWTIHDQLSALRRLARSLDYTLPK